MSKADVTETKANASGDTEHEFDEAAMAAAAQMGGNADMRPAKNFGASFKRMLGLFSPWKWVFAFATLLGAAWVVVSVTAPRVLGEATNIIFEGFVGGHLPSGVSKEQAVAQLESQGQTEFAQMLQAMHIVPGEGIDFYRLGQVLLFVLLLYFAANAIDYCSGYLLNRVVVKAMFGLRAQVEEKIHR